MRREKETLTLQHSQTKQNFLSLDHQGTARALPAGDAPAFGKSLQFRSFNSCNSQLQTVFTLKCQEFQIDALMHRLFRVKGYFLNYIFINIQHSIIGDSITCTVIVTAMIS